MRSTLVFYRSQHEHQSWLAALTTILDTCALVIVNRDARLVRPAQLTFAMARHAIADLGSLFGPVMHMVPHDRLPASEMGQLRAVLAAHGVVLREGGDADVELKGLRELYEPYVNALSDYLLMELPRWIPKEPAIDDWQSSAWDET